MFRVVPMCTSASPGDVHPGYEDRASRGVAFVVATDYERRAIAAAIACQAVGRSVVTRAGVFNCGIGFTDPGAFDRMTDYECVVSTGFAAGLDPALTQGDLLIPETVLGPGGDRTGVSQEFHGRVRDALSGHFNVSTAALMQTSRLVMSPQAKKSLFESCGAGAADMESAGIAAACALCDVPYLVLRVVLDPAGANLPQAVIPREDGLAPDAWTVARRLALRPQDLKPFLALLRYVTVSRKSLIRGVGRSLPALGGGYPT